MHIKTLRIQGFKSYRDQTTVEEFSPGHNVVVGRNGSGKSNFFAAIRFVLSDDYVIMSREQRQALLHDNATSTTATLSAFVEIVFDNSDGRFPLGSSDELVLRRTIGLKKDEYSLDRKSVTKQEVANMLEAAGFSRANPYYIVPQGRITHLTNMKDSDRLNLLKDVAGTKVYEQKRADSLKMMEETEGKKEKIHELLEYINARLAELDAERQELKDYHEKDKERRCLEYALYFKQQQDALGHGEDLKVRKQQNDIKAEEANRRFTEREKILEQLEDTLKDLKREAFMQTTERDALVEERRDLARTKAKLEAEITDAEERSEQSQESRASLEAKAADLDSRIGIAEETLMGLIPQLEDQQKLLSRARAALEDTKAKSNVLFAKQARSNQFQTRAQRDAALEAEVKSLQTYEASQTARRLEILTESRETQDKLLEIEASLADRIASVEESKASAEHTRQRWNELQAEVDQLVDRRKLLWHQKSKLQTNCEESKKERDEVRNKLDSMMDRATSNGLRSVEEITSRLELQGVYGPLYRLFHVEDRYKQAVETTAGQSLFHVVVDTDETASKILEVMNRERSGRVTFVPLNRIKPKTVSFQEKSDALLMIKKVTFDPMYKSAMHQVFARTIICPTLQVASSYVKSHDVNGITIDGDRIERKGALTGGSHDSKQSRLDTAHALGRLEKAYNTAVLQLEKMEKEVAELDQRITAIESEKQILSNQRRRVQASREDARSEIMKLEDDKATYKKRLEQQKAEEEKISTELNSCAVQVTALQEELTTPLRRGLRSEEEAELKSLTAIVDAQEKEVADQILKMQALDNQRSMLEIDLNNNLRQRGVIWGQLEIIDGAIGLIESSTDLGSTSAETVAAHKKKLVNVKKQLTERQKSLDKMESRVEDLQKKMKEAQEKHDETVRELANEARVIEKYDKTISKDIARIGEYTKQKEEAEQKIRELGVVPSEAYQKHVASSSETIVKAMLKITNALKKYSNVNKRAVEQYDNFTRQRDQLLNRHEDLETSSESIQELIETLDMRKDEAIERTFKQVSRNFGEIFEKLVPKGRGMLIMQKKFDAEEDEEEENEDDAMELDDEDRPSKKSSIENYTGVSIKVSFNSKVDEGLRIQQLSGGQKSLVALAIVFAIQKCDPAAFYLFDEIDANLDAQYRTAVAAMIQELSATAQFITTTFRPELVSVGQKHYGVLFNAQKISSLQPITQDDAYQFVEASSSQTT